MNKTKTRQTTDAVVSAVTRLRMIASAVSGVIIAAAIIAGAWYFNSQYEVHPLALFGFLVVSLGIIALAVTANIKAATKSNQADVKAPFKGASSPSVSVKSDGFGPASYKTGDEVLGWIGSVMRTDRGGLTTEAALAEKLGSPENTLILTKKELIAVTFTQPDFETVKDKGFLSNVADLSSLQDTAEGERQKVATFNRSAWPGLMDAIFQSKSLKKVLASHLSYGIPLDQIEKVEFKKPLAIGRRIDVTLTGGKRLKYSVVDKTRFDQMKADFEKAGISTA